MTTHAHKHIHNTTGPLRRRPLTRIVGSLSLVYFLAVGLKGLYGFQHVSLTCTHSDIVSCCAHCFSSLCSSSPACPLHPLRCHESVDRGLLKNLLRMLVDLQMYHDIFEMDFLRETEATYHAESLKILRDPEFTVRQLPFSVGAVLDYVFFVCL